MNRLLERNPMHCTGLARGCSAHSVTSSENGALSVERITGVSGSPSRLPPTRAARSPRSRGVFLNRWKRADHSDKARRARASKLTIVLAVVAVASAVIVTAPSLVMETAVAANHGLALIGATSVPPSFIVPAKKH